MQTIDTWLASVGLSKYASVFAEAEIDLEALPHLTEDDLRELGLPMGPRKRALAGIEAFKARAATPSEATTPPETHASLSGAERRQLTVMFVDLVGSTALSVDLDPEDMSQVIGDFQKAVSAEVAQFGGHVAKFMGDGVLVYFGWPLAHEDAAERAVRAGLSVSASVGQQQAAGKPLAVRVGVATGLVVVGDLVGEGSAQEEVVVGATPNLAARLQEVARPGDVVVSDATRHVLAPTFDFDDLGPQVLKGLADETRAFRVRGERSVESRFAARSVLGGASLIGRVSEVASLQEAWASAISGGGRLMLIEGEAGIGKSHLVQAFDDTLPPGHHKLVWQCSPYHTDSPLWPAVQQLMRAAGIGLSDTPETKVTRLSEHLKASGVMSTDGLPHLAGLLGVTPDGPEEPFTATPAQRRTHTLSALVDLLRALSADGPLFWLIEDVHWIDPTTLELLGLAMQMVPQNRILAVITARPGFELGFEDNPAVFRLLLSRLDRFRVGEIVHRISQEKLLSESLVDEIALRTDGVPLFVEEMTRTVLDSGLLEETALGWRFRLPIAELPIPTTLQDTLMARLDRLGPYKEIAQLAAIIGRSFDRSILAQLSKADPDRLSEALRTLVELDLIRPKPGDDGVYLFKHAMLRDVAYESLLRRHRQTFHLRLLEIFEAIPGHLPEILARHAEAGGDISRAITWRCEAGSGAVARGNFEEADVHLDVAEALLQSVEDAISRKRFAASVSIARAIASLVRRGHGHDDTSVLFRQSAELAEDADDPVQVVAAGYGVWAYHYVHGDVTHALEVGHNLARTGHRRQDPTISGLAASLTGIAQTMAGDLQDAHATMLKAQTVIPPGAAERLRAQVGFDLAQSTSCYLAWIELVSGAATQSRQRADAVQGTILDGEEVNGRAFKLSHAGALASERGEFARMGEIGAEMLALCEAHGLEFWKSFGHAFTGWRLLRLGQPAQAVPHLEIAYVEMKLRGGGLLGALIPGLMAEATACAGDSRALEMIADAEAETEATGRNFGRAETLRRHGRVLASLQPDTPDAAERLFREAIGVAQRQGALLWEIRAACDLAQLLDSLGHGAQGQAVLASVLERWRDPILPQELVAARALLERIDA